MKRCLPIVIVFVVILAACTSHHSKSPPATSPFTAAAPGTTARADIVVHATGLPPAAPAVVVGGMLPAFGLSGANGALDLTVSLHPGQANDLTVDALIGGHVRPVSLHVRQAAAATNRGAMSGSVATMDGQPVAGALVSYGASTVTSGSSGRFSLTHLPLGQVTAIVRADGYSPGLATADVAATGTAVSTSTRLAVLPPASIVGSSGATFHGDGWTVSVPPGALTSDQPIRVGALSYSGIVDFLGQPVVQIMPAGLRFSKPVTVALDLAMVSPHSGASSVIIVDPATLVSQHRKPAARPGVGYFVTVTAGSQIRIAPPAGGLEDPSQCAQYTALDNPQRTLARTRTWLNAWMPVASEEAWRLYDVFLTPGTGTSSRVEVTMAEALAEFAIAPQTKEAKEAVISELVRKLTAARPALRAPTSPTGGGLTQWKVGGNVKILWSGLNTPGLIAGGVGGLESPGAGASFRDQRDITGRFALIPTTDDKGVLQKVILHVRDQKLDVYDSVDFCPGALGGFLAESAGRTLVMSRLERTPYPGGGTYAKPVLWHLSTPLADVTRDVTNLYPANDPDHDGWPDTQPWQDASYKLDNCPGVANPDQADSVGGGIGDACRPATRFPSGFTAHASGSFYGQTYSVTATGRVDPISPCEVTIDPCFLTITGHIRNKHRVTRKLSDAGCSTGHGIRKWRLGNCLYKDVKGGRRGPNTLAVRLGAIRFVRR
jgi:hypothetical protein